MTNRDPWVAFFDQVARPSRLVLGKKFFHIWFIYTREGCILVLHLFFCCKVSFMKHPSVDVAQFCDQHFGRNCTKKISSSSLMVGICHLTDSHHYHHGQKPTRVGICHGGNMLGNRFESFILCSSKSFFHTFY